MTHVEHVEWTSGATQHFTCFFGRGRGLGVPRPGKAPKPRLRFWQAGQRLGEAKMLMSLGEASLAKEGKAKARKL